MLVLLLEHRHKVYIQFAIHKQDIVAFLACAFYISIVSIGILGVEEDEVAVLIGLRLFDLRTIVVESSIFALEVLEQGEADSAFVELLIAEHTELDEEFDVIPFMLKVLAVVLVHVCQFVSHLLGDVAGNLLDIIVRLEVRTRHVKRYIGRVDDAVQQGQVLGHDILHLVGDKDLIAIELYLIAMDVEVVLDAREIEYTGQVERIVDIEVDVEERLVHLGGVELVVEGLIILLGQVCRFACPCGIDIIDDVLLAGLYLLAVFPFFLHTESYLHRQELAVFLEQGLDGSVLEVLAELVVDMQDDVGASFGFDGVLHSELCLAGAGPVNGLSIGQIAEGENLHFIGYHEGAVEAQTEMADDGFGFVFVLIDELFGAGESYLVDVAVDLIGGHAYAVVGDGERFLTLINNDAYAQVAQVAFGIADGGEGFEFLCGVYGVGNQFTEEDLVVAVEEFFDDRKDVFRGYMNITFHMIDVLNFAFVGLERILPFVESSTKTVPKGRG